MKLAAILLVLVMANLQTGCENPFFEPSVRPIERALGVTVPVGYAATLAMSAMEGHATECVDFSVGNVVNITVDEDCPLPIGESPEGIITVTGVMTSEDTGMFAAVFSDVSDGNRQLMLKSVNAFLVTRFSMDRDAPEDEDQNLKVIFYDVDVELTTQVDVAQSMWLVDVDTGGTPGDPSDDMMVINGIRQGAYAGGGQGGVNQSLLAQATMHADCRRNPISGFGMIESGDSSRLADNGITMLGFTPECNGDALILLSVGMAAPSSGTRVDLNLMD